MNDYINRAEAIEKLNNALKRVFVDDVVTELLNSIPPADVVPVVRCKDCKWSDVYQVDSNFPMERWCERDIALKTVQDNDFCSWGERKDDETI